MIWSIVCEWNYSSWCVVFWVWITSRIENCYFFSVVSKIRFAMFQKTLKLLDDFDEYFWIVVSIYRFLLVLKYYLSTRITKKNNIIITRPAQAIQCKFSCNDLILLFQQSTNSSTSFQINIQHVEQQQQQNLIASVLATRIKNYNIIDKIVFYRLDHSTFIKWRRDESKIQREKTNRRKHIKWNCEIFVIIVE